MTRHGSLNSTTTHPALGAPTTQRLTAHRCSNCFVAQYNIKSNVPCKNEWWPLWDAHSRESQHELRV